MDNDLETLKAEAEASIASAPDLRAWDAIRVSLLGRNGTLTALLKDLGKTPPEQRRDRGAALNRLKDALTQALETRRQQLESAALEAKLATERIDPTLPPRPRPRGLIHPISRTSEEIAAIFGAMGFAIAEGPDIETDWHNFSPSTSPPITRRGTIRTRSTWPPRPTPPPRSCAPTPPRCRSAP